MVKFGERLKAARTAKHMSQQALADVIGKSLNTVGLYERGLRCACWQIRWMYPATISLHGLKPRRWPRFPNPLTIRSHFAFPESKIIWVLIDI